MSSTSDKYEKDVADNINGTIKGLKALRPKVSTSYPDVMLEYAKFTGSNAVWVEVKMNHTDNLMNPRFQYIKGKWSVPESYKSVATDKLAEMLNADRPTKLWIADLKKYAKENGFKGDVEKMSLYSSVTARRNDPNSISLSIMKGFLATRPNKNITKIPGVDVGSLVTLHYTKGKAAVAYYVAAGDDFYQFGNANPLKIPKVPKFKGSNDVVFRVGDRSSNFEIQAEVKLKTIADSPYSCKPGSSKDNPFRFIGI